MGVKEIGEVRVLVRSSLNSLHSFLSMLSGPPEPSETRIIREPFQRYRVKKWISVKSDLRVSHS